jgi:hypothetical protein
MCLPAARPRFADLMGIGLSLTCLIHCLALPLLILIAPALSRWIALPEWVHAAILLLALPAAMIAMRGGWRRHGRLTPGVLAVVGLGLLALGLAAHEGWIAVADRAVADRMLTSLGALMLATAHVINWCWRHAGRAHTLRP